MDDCVRRIFIVDDHPLVREGLALLIGDMADLVVCGEAGSVREALTAVRAAEPDAVVVDLVLPDGDGVVLVRRLAARYPRLRILVCSVRDGTLYAQRAMRAGAHGYIGKHEPAEAFVAALRQVLDGKFYLNPLLVETFVSGSEPRHESNAGGIETLTDRELEIFAFIGRGLTTTEIAARLHLSVKTVETHREKIKRKLGIADGKALARIAIAWDLDHLQ